MAAGGQLWGGAAGDWREQLRGLGGRTGLVVSTGQQYSCEAGLGPKLGRGLEDLWCYKAFALHVRRFNTTWFQHYSDSTL